MIGGNGKKVESVIMVKLILMDVQGMSVKLPMLQVVISSGLPVVQICPPPPRTFVNLNIFHPQMFFPL